MLAAPLVDSGRVARVREQLRVSSAIARVLVARQLDNELALGAFLSPRLSYLRRPEGLPDFDRAVARLRDAVVAGQRIGVFGDYDVDGVTSSALVAGFLRQLGATVEVDVASREMGYGLSVLAMQSFIAAGCQVVVATDCGTSDTAALLAAHAAGIDVIVIDHHTVPNPKELHPSFALVNPRRHETTFPFGGLASVGLAFYVMAALRTALREDPSFAERPLPDVREWLDLVAIGTIADLVPMVEENRILTALGLATLARRARPGLAALMDLAGLPREQPITGKQVAFKLAPRINAPGRVGSARASLELMLAAPETASAWATQLEAANTTRRSWQDDVHRQACVEAERYAESPALVVGRVGWQHGVVGIVAAKLVDAFDKPAFVIGIDEHGLGRGSARTAGGINVYEALASAAPWLQTFGGHAAAAGFSVEASNIAHVRHAIDAYVAACPRVAEAAVCDAELSLREVDERLAGELDALAPFGPEHPEVKFLIRGARVRSCRAVGDGSHLRMELEDASGAVRTAIAFGQAANTPVLGDLIDAIAVVVRNVWQGRARIELEVASFTSAYAALTVDGKSVGPLAHVGHLS